MKKLTLDSTAALARAHAALLNDLRKLKAFIASPNVDMIQLVDRLDMTVTRLAEHFRLEEENGYMDAIRTRSPHLEHAIDKLKEEHVQLLKTSKKLLEEAGSSSRIDDGLRKKFHDFIAAVRDHEERENVLVEDAFNLDIAAED